MGVAGGFSPDAAACLGVVRDAMDLLQWCARPDATLIDEETGGRARVVPDDLRESYLAAVLQLREAHFRAAEAALRGETEEYPSARVDEILEAAGWTGPLRDFKLRALDLGGRREAMAVVREPQARIMGRRLWRRFVPLLNAALESLSGIPGVAAIQELKDFVEAIVGA
jgi:hypothetical protein